MGDAVSGQPPTHIPSMNGSLVQNPNVGKLLSLGFDSHPPKNYRPDHSSIDNASPVEPDWEYIND